MDGPVARRLGRGRFRWRSGPPDALEVATGAALCGRLEGVVGVPGGGLYHRRLRAPEEVVEL